MDRIIRLHIERLPEGVYLATSEDVQGLVVQADTVQELLKLVPELVALLEEVSAEYGFAEPSGQPLPQSFDLPFVLAA